MMALIGKFHFKKIERIIRKSLEAIHLKSLVYKIIMIPTQEIALYRLRKIMKNSNPPGKKTSGKKILFNSVDARHMPHTYLEGGIAKFLEMRGHNVKMLICNSTLSICTSHFTAEKPPNAWSCKNCIKFSKKFYEITKLPYATYNDYITQDEKNTIENKVKKMSLEECEKLVYKGIKVGFHAVTSAQRYLKGEIPEKTIYEPILRAELINAIITTDVADKAYKKEKPDILVSSHGCYSSWGSFSDYMLNKKVNTYIWGSGETNTMRFVIPKSNFKKYFKEIRKEKMLNEKEEKELTLFLNRRFKGEAGQVVLYGFSDTKADTLEKQFNFDKFDKTFLMLPNVPWDAAAVSKQGPFKDVIEWIDYIINLFKKHPNFLLIIKVHPSELYEAESKETVFDYINEKFTSLPENIKIIPPDTTINPYSLFQFTDVGLIFTGTAGIEMTLSGIPVLPAGDAHYANKGFTFDAKTKKEYEKLLLKDISLSSYQKNLVRVYAYFHFIKTYIPRDFINSNNFITTGWTFNSLEETKPGKSKYIDTICDFIINGGVYQNW